LEYKKKRSAASLSRFVAWLSKPRSRFRDDLGGRVGPYSLNVSSLEHYLALSQYNELYERADKLNISECLMLMPSLKMPKKIRVMIAGP